MKSYRITLVAALTLAAAVSCSESAKVEGVLSDAPGKNVVVRLLDVNTYKTLDTLSVGPEGNFSCKIDVAEGRPEFVYLFYGDTKIASLLLMKGDKVKVTCDTLGRYSVEGSPESVLLQGVEQRFASFASDMTGLVEELDDPQLTPSQKTELNAAITKLYISHYREDVRYVTTNKGSLTCIPVLYETLNEYSPIFGQPTDALHFRNVCDSLKTLYPESRYVKALEQETVRRENVLGLGNRLSNASEAGFPDVTLPDVKGEKVALSSVDAKVILLHFWDASEPTQKMLNIEELLPLYEEFHPRGFEIYSVCVTPDKASWASVVKAQKLPWINVNDGKGGASYAVGIYNVSSVPTSYIIADGSILPGPVSGGEGLRKELVKLL